MPTKGDVNLTIENEETKCYRRSLDCGEGKPVGAARARFPANSHKRPFFHHSLQAPCICRETSNNRAKKSPNISFLICVRVECLKGAGEHKENFLDLPLAIGSHLSCSLTSKSYGSRAGPSWSRDIWLSEFSGDASAAASPSLGGETDIFYIDWLDSV